VTGPNGQASDRDLAVQWRAVSARLRAAGTSCYDAADAVLTTGPRPGLAESVYDAGSDLMALAGDLARVLALTERQRDNESIGKDDTS
jgi:hypothetical protein